MNSNTKDDMLAAGFHKLDGNLIDNSAPKIKWGLLYKGFTNEDKINYLEKFAESMNHAAYLIQEERNVLGNLCEQKEAQLISLSRSSQMSQQTLQEQIIHMNMERQEFNLAINELRKTICELKDKQ